MSLLDEIRVAISEAEIKLVSEKVEQAIQEGIPANSILNDALIPGMTEVGCMFEEGEYFVPDMLVAARAMKGALQILEPHLVEDEDEKLGKVAIGTVKGDLHDIGKSLVAMMLESSGFEIVDLGVDVSAEQFVDEIKNGANFIAISALLTTTMMNMKSTIQDIEKAGVRDQVKILVGGAPVTQEFAESIGADGFATDAPGAVRVAKTFL
jgi:5-methyltetrahydrofolate--homocysteine methyltransferase